MRPRLNQTLKTSIVIEMQGNDFPFGEFHINPYDPEQCRKISVRKRVSYRNQTEKLLIETKLNHLKQLNHRNVINIKKISQQLGNQFMLYYNYIPESLQTAFNEIDHSIFKELNRQIIQLVIHLAKNYVLTNFNPNRCGVVFVDGNFLIKYYLPLKQIVITQDIQALERSVQLFKIQAMNFIDSLRNQQKIGLKYSQTSIDLNIRTKSPKAQRTKNSDIFSPRSNQRKLSIDTLRYRRFSHFSHFHDTINQIRKRRQSQDSTQITQKRITSLKRTFKTLRNESQGKRHIQRSRQKLKLQIEVIKIRSAKALRLFQMLKKNITDYVALSRLIALCNQL